MPEVHRVMWVRHTNRPSAHERLTHIAGLVSNETPWKMSQEEAIAGIEKGKWRFYVSIGDKMVGVIVATSYFGHKYLKTEVDGIHPNNLLKLPECPEAVLATGT